MLVIDRSTINHVAGAIVSATHVMTDHFGRPARLGTIDAKALESAVLAGLVIITGQAVIPLDDKITPEKRKRIVFVEDDD